MKLTKVKIIKKILLPLLVGFSFVATATSSLAWFTKGVNINFDGTDADFTISAGAEASYYGGGSGASDDPYIISNKLHLYNLAWLQYIGTYNKNSIRQLYFEVTADIDMDGITLPPIGTDQYPFLGHFDGGGKTISNLTISNDNPLNSESAFGVMKPGDVALTGTTPSDIIGFFGVVGKLPTQDFTYDSTIVSMADFTISNINVNSVSDQTLIGLAAGYVNGSMTGVKVGGKSSLTVDEQTAVSSTLTNNLSDYGLVGYAANKGAGGEYMQTLSKYYDSDDDSQGGGENWGGSIDMLSLYNRLTDIQTKVSNVTVPYVYNESYLNSTYEDRVVANNASYRRYSKNTNNDFAGNFNLTSSQTNKVYLVGGHYVNKLYYTNYNEQGYYITDGNGHYLTYNGTALANTTMDNACIWHFTNTSGTAQIYMEYFNTSTLVLTSYYLRNNNGTLTTATTNNITTWTLNKNGNELSIVNNNYHLVYYNNNWVLRTNGQGDIITDVDDPDFYVIGNADESYYISNSITNSTAVGRTTDINQAANLTLDASNRMIASSGGTNYYLCLYKDNGARWRVTNNATGNYTPFIYNSVNSTFSATYNSRTYYLRYSGGFSASTTSYAVTVVGCSSETIRNSNTLDSAAISRTGRQLSSNTGNMEFSSEDTTYFPINAYPTEQRDEMNNVIAKQYEPIATNTGYVVAGTVRETYATDNRSMVVSHYPRDRILYNGTDSNGNLANIRTINASGVQYLDEDSLHKYNDYTDEEGETVEGSKTKFQKVIKSSSNVGGLHFVNKNTDPAFFISKNNVVDATNVKVNGATYTGDTTYQLPVYSIDFNLKKQGYINFFAGTYNGGYSTGTATERAGTVDDDHINAFFSLHKIDRDSSDKTKIDNIREIKGIYSSDGSVNYTYSYKKYASNSNAYTVVDENGNPFDDSDLTLLFDTDWIGYRPGRELANQSAVDPNDATKGTLGGIFYFEIPVDSGEYCLGNVKNSVDAHDAEGCYLMYLDIGANGTEATDNYTGYCITTYVDPVNFPTGVDFAIEGLTNDGLGGETLCVFIPVGESGTIYFSVNEEDSDGDTIDIDDASQISQYSYISSNVDTVFDITGTHLPADYEDPPDSGPIITRVSYLSIVKPSGEKYLVTVTDQLDSEGEVTSTVYHLSYTDENDELVSYDCTLAELQTALPSAEDYYINSVRNMITIVTLERVTATSVSFNAELPELPWTNASNIYLITVNVPEGYSIRVTVTNSANYTVCINSEDALVFTNNTVVYTEPVQP